MNRIGLTSELGSIQAFVNIKGKSLFRESKNKIFGNGMVEQVICAKYDNEGQNPGISLINSLGPDNL